MATAIPYIVSIGGTLLSSYSQYQSGQTQGQAYNIQGDILESEAVAEKERAEYEEKLQRRKTAALLGQQRSLYAKSGVDIYSGSPLMVMADTAAKGEEEALMIRKGGDVAATSKRNKATLARYYGSQSKKSGMFGAFGSTLEGVGDYYSLIK